MSARRAALLKTFASVPPSARVLDLGTDAVADLARLGFDVWASTSASEKPRQSVVDVLGEEEASRRVTTARPDALGYPTAHFDWAAVSLAPGDNGEEVLREVRRVLRPGAWVWVSADALAPEALVALAEAADLVIAETPVADADGSLGIFRRVGEGVGA